MKGIICSILIFTASLSQAQDLDKKYIHFLAGGGTSVYHGDLCQGFECGNFGYDLTLGMRFLLTNHISFRPQLHFSKHFGENNAYEFYSNSASFTPAFQYDFIPSSQVCPYAFTGPGILNFNPKDQNDQELQPLQNEGVSYSRIAGFWAFGAGIRFNVSDYFALNIEAYHSRTLTDYLDDISARGDSDNNDHYTTFNFTLEFRIASQLGTECPSDYWKK